MEFIDMNRNAKAFVSAATKLFGANGILNRDQIQKVVEESAVPYPFWFVTRQEYRASRGQYRLPDAPDVVGQVTETPTAVEKAAVVELASVTILRQKKLHDDSDTSIPEKFAGYVIS